MIFAGEGEGRGMLRNYINERRKENCREKGLRRERVDIYRKYRGKKQEFQKYKNGSERE